MIFSNYKNLNSETIKWRSCFIAYLTLTFLFFPLNTIASAIEGHVFLSDHLGNVVTITDQQGVVLQRNVITPYGAISRMTDGAGNVILMQQSKTKRLFTGHYFDQESNLHYMNARYYDVASKRFASLDPLYYGNEPGKAFSNIEGSTMASNAMMYVEGRATTYIDPTGEFALIPIMMGIAALSRAAPAISKAAPKVANAVGAAATRVAPIINNAIKGAAAAVGVDTGFQVAGNAASGRPIGQIDTNRTKTAATVGAITGPVLGGVLTHAGNVKNAGNAVKGVRDAIATAEKVGMRGSKLEAAKAGLRNAKQDLCCASATLGAAAAGSLAAQGTAKKEVRANVGQENVDTGEAITKKFNMIRSMFNGSMFDRH